MCFKGGDLLGGIVVVDTELEVIRTANDPVLPRNELTSTNGDIGELESFDNRLDKRLVCIGMIDPVRTYLCLV